MDTRSKILTAEEAAARYTDTPVVLATFDVLTAPRIRRLREIAAQARTLIAIVQEVPGSLLPLRARAELAASLAIIDCVIETGADAIVAKASAIFDEREAEQRHTAELIEHVQRRNG